MFFSTLALMFGAMSFSSSYVGAIANNSFTHTKPYGNAMDVYTYSFEMDMRDFEEIGDENEIVHCLDADLTGTETTYFDGEYIETSTTYKDFLRIQAKHMNYDDDPNDYVSFQVYCRLGYQVAPSFFVEINVDGGSYDQFTQTASSYGGDDGGLLEVFEFSVDDVVGNNYFNVDISLYFVKTEHQDPMIALSDDYDTGYDNGYQQGKQDGYNLGKDDGHQDGYTEGYNYGYGVGHQIGYQEGMSTALSTHSFSFTNLFASISDTPILMIRRLFGFEVFGTSILAVVMSLFTALIVVKLIKKVI